MYRTNSTADNNKVFVACEAQTLKTRLNETDQPLHTLIPYGLCDETVFFNVVLKMYELGMQSKNVLSLYF